ncbi:DUF1206 domain-containing protein [Actinophytocola sp.]|uniref:DUF1206 domain-containing protein n=1 Tax=Actinophytocola sp. TaxID=1872138 RepID=UPI002D6CEDB5|nr:DUF1206 domain-containing protein [Actinophytocola sp.]HYQ68467.1 DUF1206 domain-containing protein [Actinophytocola sp.]
MVAISAQRAKNNGAVQVLGRIGMGCYGVVHLIVAYLALRVAFGDSGEQADQKGALQEVGATSFGAIVLWVLAIGLFAYGLWQFMMAAIGFQWVQKKGKRTRKRIGSVARGIIGISLGVYAVRLVTGSGGGQSGNQGQQEWTGKLLSLPAGRVLVAIVAAIVIGVAVGEIVRGVKRSFLQDLNLDELPAGTQRWVRRLGFFGYIAKGVVLGIVGILLGIAAFQSDAKEAGGLDRALKTLAAQPFGTIALVLVAVGLAAFGVYCFAAARAHKS